LYNSKIKNFSHTSDIKLETNVNKRNQSTFKLYYITLTLLINAE